MPRLSLYEVSLNQSEGQHMNSDSNTDIRFAAAAAFSVGVDPHRVAVAVLVASPSSEVAKSDVDFLSLLKNITPKFSAIMPHSYRVTGQYLSCIVSFQILRQWVH